MKSKNRYLSKKQIQLRLILSITMVLALFAVVWGSVYFIRTDKKIAGTPGIIRRSFLWDEKVSRAFFSPNRLTKASIEIPAGKKPRVNGMLGLKSELNLSDYKIDVKSGKKSLSLTVDAIKVIQKTQTSMEFKCIEGWSDNISYSGAKFSEFMNFYDLGKKPDGSYYAYVGLETPDGKYYVSMDMESMLHDQTLLSYEMNGEELSLENGAPIRLLIPIKYGIKSLKRIGKITFSDERPRDYWAERGYDWYSGL